MQLTKQEWMGQYPNLSEMEKDLLSRCYDTLMNNIFETDKYKWGSYRCLSPGINHFRGIWNWDSAFHSAGVSRWDGELAKEGILGFFQFQKEDGLLPDVIWCNGDINDAYGKPPVFAWAIEIMHRRDNDTEFLRTMYPKLTLNENFWATQRCSDGLFFYDSADKDDPDYDLHIRWESGWDNAVRWDKPIIEQWAIDLNCFMVMFYRSLSYIAEQLDLSDDVAKWNDKEKTLVELINKKLWSEENQWYADANRFTDEVSEVLTPASFMPLYIGIADQKRAERMGEIAADEKRFNSHMPTVSYDSYGFSNDYWRGPVWLNVAYFAAKGLKNYNLPVADAIKKNILEMCDKEKRGIFENYDSVNNVGLCCDMFSWSSVFIIEFILNF